MNTINTKINKVLVSAGLLSLVAVAPVKAQTLRSFVLVNDQSEVSSINVSENSGSTFQNVNAGRYKGTLNGVQVNIECNDLTHGINFGSGYTANVQYNITSPAGTISSSYYQGGLASVLMNGDYTTVSTPEANKRASEHAWLIDNFINSTAATYAGGASGSTNLNVNLAAFQLAIWDINQDGGDGMSAGNLQLGASSASYATEVNYFETLAAAHQTYSSTNDTFIQGPSTGIGAHAQFFSAVVPEPSTYAMMAGMAIAGAAMLRKRSRRSVK